MVDLDLPVPSSRTHLHNLWVPSLDRFGPVADERHDFAQLKRQRGDDALDCHHVTIMARSWHRILWVGAKRTGY